MPAHRHPLRPHRRAAAARARAARRAAEPLAWWVVLLALYLALVSALTLAQVTIGAAAAAAGAAAATVSNRSLFTSGGSGEPAAGRARRRRPATLARLLPALVLLPGQVLADSTRIIVRGSAGGDWTPLAVAPGRADRGTAALMMSAAPGTYVGGVDPERELMRVHRLVQDPSPYERSLRRAGLVSDPERRGPS